MPNMPPLAPPATTAETRGRTVGKAAFGLLVAVPTLLWALQIIGQAFGTPEPSALPCRSGLTLLISGIEQARQSAFARTNESDALAAFRSNLGPQWATPRAVREKCKGDGELASMFGRVERLRYAEEHAVRYESRGIASDRRAVERLKQRLQRPSSVPGTTAAP